MAPKVVLSVEYSLEYIYAKFWLSKSLIDFTRMILHFESNDFELDESWPTFFVRWEAGLDPIQVQNHLIFYFKDALQNLFLG